MARLSLAFDTGLARNDGPVALLHPPIAFDVAGLLAPLIIQPHVALNAAWQNQGFVCDVALPARHFALAVVCCTRSKQQTADLIAQAAACADIVVVDGQKN